MGMAASQARLLSITSRLHDVEYKAQNLQNAKLQLSTQQDEAYEDYLKALDQRTLTFASIDANGNRSDLVATFNNLFSVNAANTATGNNYALIDSRGRVVVSDDLEDGYDGFTHSNYVQNANLFALYMVYGDDFASDDLFNQVANEVLNNRIATDTHLAELYSAATGRSGDGRTQNNHNNNNNNNQSGSGSGSSGASYNHGSGTGNTVNSGTGSAASTTVVSGKDPVVPDPVIPPRPSVLGSLTAPSQNKPPQRGGDPVDGGKGGNGGRGNSTTGSTFSNTGRPTGAETANTTTTTTTTTSNHSGRVPVDDNTPPQQPTPPVQPDSIPETITGVNPPDPVTPPNNNNNNLLLLPPGDASLSEVYSSSHIEEAQQFLNYFFNTYRMEIFNNTQLEASNLQNFNYYVRMFNAIQQHGGCISIENFNGPDGSAANNSEWLTAMIESGQFSIEVFNTDAHGNVTLSGTGVDSDQNLCFAATTQIDKRAMAKAEAAYEHALKMIDKKEKKIDNELSKIENERNALTKEIDSAKKVAEENVERTFGIFS